MATMNALIPNQWPQNDSVDVSSTIALCLERRDPNVTVIFSIVCKNVRNFCSGSIVHLKKEYHWR